MFVSFEGTTITVKIPSAEWSTPSSAPFSINFGMGEALTVIHPTVLNNEGSWVFTAQAVPGIVYSFGQTGGAGITNLMSGDRYELQAQDGGVARFINLDLDDSAPTLVSIGPVADSGLDLSDILQSGLTNLIAQFSEAVIGVQPKSFSVDIAGSPSTPAITVQGFNLSNAGVAIPTTTTSSAASFYLVSVPNPDSGVVGVTLYEPPTVLSVQEYSQQPVSSETAYPVDDSTAATHWVKVTLDGGVDQLMTAGGVQSLSIETAGNDAGRAMPDPSNPVKVTLEGVESGVLFLGFDSDPTPSSAPTNIKILSTDAPIKDRALNELDLSGASGTTPKYLDIAGEAMFSSWGDNTTTIGDASVFGYANGANDSSSYDTYSTYATASDIETIDLSGITSSPIIINANAGQAYVYVGDEALVLDVENFDRYILNDRYQDDNGNFVLGNEFYGTADSEYVVVGSGGDNYLVAGNRFSGDWTSETDIVDYSQLSMGVDIKLGDKANLAVSVGYKDGTTDRDTLFGFEGVVGSGGADDISGSNVGNFLAGGDGDDVLRGYTDANYSQAVSAVVIAEIDVYNAARAVDEATKDLDLATASAIGSSITTAQVALDVAETQKTDADQSVIVKTGELSALALALGDAQLDKLYDQTHIDQTYGTEENFNAGQFYVDSSDILYGGAGEDKLYGGAGSDMLIDLDSAEMWGSDKTGFNGGDSETGLRDSANKELAEKDIFVLRGDESGTATVNNFHLSKDGTGLAGRSYSANDALVFSVDTSALGTDIAGLDGEALYKYVYSRLTFEQTQVGTTDDYELVASFKDTSDGTSIQVGSATIAGMGEMLADGANRTEVVELKWLSDRFENSDTSFNPKIDEDMLDLVPAVELGSALNIAVALELQQAGTVRGSNEYGVMAAKLSDNDLDERVYNPGDSDDRILGTANDDSYEYIVQKFDTSNDNHVGSDTIFDVGGKNDVLMFESAAVENLTFSAVMVGRESHANSLRVSYDQTEVLDGDMIVKNSGDVTWQGHFQEGGRQAAETLKVAGHEYDIAQAHYVYDEKGYVMGGPTITASNARDVIMVGQGADDKFVFDFDPVKLSSDDHQPHTARIAGFGGNDKIDISRFGAVDGSNIAETFVGDRDSEANITFESGFILKLSFQDVVVSASELDLALTLSTSAT